MQRRLLNKFINSLKNLDLKYIEEKILDKTDEINSKNLHISYDNQHPIFEITEAVFKAIKENPNSQEKLLDIYSHYIRLSKFTLDIPYYNNRNISYSYDLFAFINYRLSNKANDSNILKEINNTIIKSGLNQNISSNYPPSFIISILGKKRNTDDEKFVAFNQYLSKFYFDNFDFSNKNNNSNIISNVIIYFIESYGSPDQDSYAILLNLLNNINIEYDTNIIRENIKNHLNNKTYTTVIHPEIADILIKYDFDYIVQEKEKLYLYPYFMNHDEANLELPQKYANHKGIFYQEQNFITFENAYSYIIKTIDSKFSIPSNVLEKQKNNFEITKYDNFYDIPYKIYKNKEILHNIKKRELEHKLNFIEQYDLNINHNKLIDSINNKIKHIKTLNTLHREDAIYTNIMDFINFHIKHINYTEKEQPLIETIHLINSLPKNKTLKDFIIEKTKELKFSDEHFYNNITFKEIKLTLKIDNNKYIPHVDAEKLLSVSIRKNVNKIDRDFVYNNNSIFPSLFSPHGKYTWGMNNKRREICNFLDSKNKMDPIYCIVDGQKILRSEHLSQNMIKNRLFDMQSIDYLMKQVKQEANFNIKEPSKKRQDFFSFICFQRSLSFFSEQEYFSKLADELYTDDDFYLKEFFNSFYLKKEDYNTVSIQAYEINYKDSDYVSLLNKIKKVKDNSFLNKIKETVLNNFKGDKEDFDNFKTIIHSIKERNEINSLIDNKSTEKDKDHNKRRI